MRNRGNRLSFILIGLWLGITMLSGAVTPLPHEVSFTVCPDVAGVKQPVLSLNGTWRFKYDPEAPWTRIRVPGEAAMQGYAIRHDLPFIYRRSFTVPADYAGKRTILRFDGVYSHARLFINGKFIREHHGGFTRWETDVTAFIRPGKKNELQVEVTDRLDDISYASGYAHHPIGGILRDVSFFALPETGLSDFYMETQLDESYRDAVLKVAFQGPDRSLLPPVNARGAGKGMEVEYRLADPKGREVSLSQSVFPVREKENVHELPVADPVKWDAEHPELYTLTVIQKKEGKEICRFTRRVGFRAIRIEGDRLLVNGSPVKLRGACRHDLDPVWGRSASARLDSLDALLFKRANMNFVRTSHYPPSETFLNYCDELGIYVECETAVCFVDTYRQKNYAPGRTQDSAAFASRYLSQCREMVKTFRSHPAILFWSIGNESQYGSNFRHCWDWVKTADRTRPVIFSYPGTVGEKEAIYDILSMHYPGVDGNLDQWNRSVRRFQGHGIPALFDEWAHPACYTYETLQQDPNIREFWGASLDMMWRNVFDSPGALGGAIWGYVDETFSLPEPKAGTPFWKEFARTAKPEAYQGNCVGYGEWGIVDVWRREKPEFWATKKAYSPVKLSVTHLSDFVSGERLLLPVHNRFDHTDLKEIKIRYVYKGKEKELKAPALEPHGKGILVIPAEDWSEGDSVGIRFFSASGELIDAEQLTLGGAPVSFPSAKREGSLRIEETADRIIIKGTDFEIPFSKESGLIENAVADGDVFIENGPFLHLDINLNHLSGAEIRKSADRFRLSEKEWKKEFFAYRRQTNRIAIELKGRYRKIAVDFHLLIYPEGKMTVDYIVEGHPNGFVRETGLSFLLGGFPDGLSWQRKGYWSCYPEKAFAGNIGQVPLFNDKKERYGIEPDQPWMSDAYDYYYWADAGSDCVRPLTRAAKGMKENIYVYTLSDTDGKRNLSILSPDASLACRLSKRPDEQLVLYVNNRWDYPEIAWGNYCKMLEAVPCFGKVEIVF